MNYSLEKISRIRKNDIEKRRIVDILSLLAIL